jgi:hypothetical protein
MDEFTKPTRIGGQEFDEEKCACDFFTILDKIQRNHNAKYI